MVRRQKCRERHLYAPEARVHLLLERGYALPHLLLHHSDLVVKNQVAVGLRVAVLTLLALGAVMAKAVECRAEAAGGGSLRGAPGPLLVRLIAIPACLDHACGAP